MYSRHINLDEIFGIAFKYAVFGNHCCINIQLYSCLHIRAKRYQNFGTLQCAIQNRTYAVFAYHRCINNPILFITHIRETISKIWHVTTRDVSLFSIIQTKRMFRDF